MKIELKKKIFAAKMSRQLKQFINSERNLQMLMAFINREFKNRTFKHFKENYSTNNNSFKACDDFFNLDSEEKEVVLRWLANLVWCYNTNYYILQQLLPGFTTFLYKYIGFLGRNFRGKARYNYVLVYWDNLMYFITDFTSTCFNSLLNLPFVKHTSTNLLDKYSEISFHKTGIIDKNDIDEVDLCALLLQTKPLPSELL